MASQAVLELLVELKGDAEKDVSSLGGMLKSVGGIAGGVALAGVAAFGAAVISGIGDAREAAQIMAQTENVIRSTGGAAGVSAQQVADYAGALSAASGASLFGDSQIQESTNLLLTFTNIKDKTLEAATAISVDMAQALGGAPKDAAIQLGKALNDPIAGISALSRVGVSFTEEQKEQIKTMQESGDMAGAQAVILAELNKEFGGSAQAAADADGGWAQFNDRLGEAKEALGAAVLPLLSVLVGVLNDQVMPAIEAGAEVFGTLVAAAQEAIPPVVAMFTDLLGPALGDNAAFFEQTFAQISEIVTGVVGIVMALLGELASFIRAHGTEIKLVLSAAWEIIKAVITGALALINGVVQTALALLRGDWQGAWEAIKTMSATFVQALLDVIKGGLDLIAGFFGTSIDKIIALWRNLGSQAISLGSNIVAGIIQGIQNAAGALYDAVANLISNAFSAGEDAGKIQSPSKLFADGIGVPIVQGIIVGVKNTIPDLLGVIDKMGIAMIDALKKKTPQAIAAIEKLIEDLEKQAVSIGSRINDAIADGFKSEASIDRLLADNLEAITAFTGKLGNQVAQDLDEALKAATQFADPALAAGFYKLRSDQIIELAELQEKLNNDLSSKDRARLDAQRVELEKQLEDVTGDEADAIRTQIESLDALLKGDLTDAQRQILEQQQALIAAAQQADQSAFRAGAANQQSPQAQLIAQLQALMPQLPGVLDSPIVAQLKAMLDQLTSGAGGAFSTPTFALPTGPISNRPGAPIVYNNTFNLPPGTPKQLADEVIRQLSQQTSTRRA